MIIKLLNSIESNILARYTRPHIQEKNHVFPILLIEWLNEVKKITKNCWSGNY